MMINALQVNALSTFTPAPTVPTSVSTLARAATGLGSSGASAPTFASAPNLASAPTGALADTSASELTSFTPDALMAYCQARLDSIDGQAQASFDLQSQNANVTQSIQQIANSFKENSSAAVTDAATYNTLHSQLDTAIGNLQAVDPNSPALTKLLTTRAAMEQSWKADNNLATTELEGYAQDMSDAATDLNSSSELQMVQLQSLMAQRQTAITLTTNLVQSLGDQENKVADNIGK